MIFIYIKRKTMKFAILFLLLVLFYERMRKNLEALTLDLIALVLGAVGLIVKIIRRKNTRRNENDLKQELHD